VLVAVGRVPNTAHLALRASHRIAPERIYPVNDHLAPARRGYTQSATSLPSDAGAQSRGGRGGVRRALATGRGHVNYDANRGVVYTEPEIASVGKNGEQLKEMGTAYRKACFRFEPTRAHARLTGRGLGEDFGRRQKRIDPGVHILGHMRRLNQRSGGVDQFWASSEDLGAHVTFHPTLGEALRKQPSGGGEPLNI